MAGDFDRSALLEVQDVPALAPLVHSHEANDLEAELKALFVELFEAHVRPAERFINLAGVPHLGDFSLVEAAVKTEGLAILRKQDEAAMRYLYKAWRGRNQKRGLAMLKLYLQLLWPDAWTCHQMWCRSLSLYPLGLAETRVGGTYFLTSRVKVTIDANAAENGLDVGATAASLRSVTPARIVLEVTVNADSQIEDLCAVAGAAQILVHSFDAECV